MQSSSIKMYVYRCRKGVRNYSPAKGIEYFVLFCFIKLQHC